jgi:hypothetical protein
MRRWVIVASLWFLSGCGGVDQRSSIILLAPFEGRYREIGYEALYAARLALSDSQAAFDLLPIDDGGTTEFAIQRARAIARLDNAAAVILLGQHAVSTEVQESLSPLPTWIVGWWGNEAQFAHVSELFPPGMMALAGQYDRETLPTLAQIPDLEAVGDIGGLLGFARLRLDAGLPLENVTILSAGRLPDPEFSQRYLDGAPFASPPRLIASQVYDAVMLISHAAVSGLTDRDLALYAYRLDEQGELRLDHVVE